MDYLSNCNDTEYPTENLSENGYICSVQMAILKLNFSIQRVPAQAS